MRTPTRKEERTVVHYDKTESGKPMRWTIVKERGAYLLIERAHGMYSLWVHSSVVVRTIETSTVVLKTIARAAESVGDALAGDQ